MTWEGLSPPYSTIVADPPWTYANTPTPWQKQVRKRSLDYSVMGLEEISALPVCELSQPGAHLYLWTTNRYLRDAFDVAEAWGFAPVTTLVWCKYPHGVSWGGRFSVTTEFMLFCRDTRRVGAVIRAARESAGFSQTELVELVRGRKTGLAERWEADACLPNRVDWQRICEVLPTLAGAPYPSVVEPQTAKVDSSWFLWPRGAHSAKPAAFGDLVEQVSPGPYVELFARAPRLGWDSWGRGYEVVAS